MRGLKLHFLKITTSFLQADIKPSSDKQDLINFLNQAENKCLKSS